MAREQMSRNRQRPLSLKLVSVADIPSATETPIDNLLDLYKQGLEMLELCRREKGKGLSAVQVGLPWNFFVVDQVSEAFADRLDLERHSPQFFVNCDYVPDGVDQIDSVEGCLSLKNKDGSFRRFTVPRATRIRLKGSLLVDHPTLQLKSIDVLLGLNSEAVVLQHEIDHAKGRLVSEWKEIFFY